MYAATGKSVRGGCSGLPAQPRSPLNFRPRIVSVGRTENLRIGSSSPPVVSRPAPPTRMAGGGDHHAATTLGRLEAGFEVVAPEPVEHPLDEGRVHPADELG